MPIDDKPLVYRGPAFLDFGSEKDKEEERRAAEAVLASIAAGANQIDDTPIKAVEREEDTPLHKQSLFQRISDTLKRKTKEQRFPTEDDQLDEATRALNALPEEQKSFILEDPMERMTMADVERYKNILAFVQKTDKYKSASEEEKQKIIDNLFSETIEQSKKINPYLPPDQRLRLKLEKK